MLHTSVRIAHVSEKESCDLGSTSVTRAFCLVCWFSLDCFVAFVSHVLFDMFLEDVSVRVLLFTFTFVS